MLMDLAFCLVRRDCVGRNDQREERRRSISPAQALLSESGQRGSPSLEVVFESFLKSKPAADYHQL
jgi:hypothetical protein